MVRAFGICVQLKASTREAWQGRGGPGSGLQESSVAVARSIHTTHRDFDEATRTSWSSDEKHDEELERLREAIWKKRRIKKQVAQERRHGTRDRELFVDSAAIPIRIRDEGPCVHYPASAEDILGVMRFLPRGLTVGVSAIELSLGLGEQSAPDLEWEGEPDPLTGREGIEVFPGVYGGRILGAYRGEDSRVCIYAYVYEPSLPNRQLKETLLRLELLTTLVHELAHHHDHRSRTARGRWRADDQEKVEIYAESREYEWIQGAVIPYMEKVASPEIDALQDWLLLHGGAKAPLAVLADDPRVTGKEGRCFRWVFSVRGALSTLFDDVEKGGEPVATRLEFARQLHYVEEYSIAREIIAGVLRERPGHPEALTLEADIDVHEGEHARAEALCRRVLATQPSLVDAWEVLCDSLLGSGRWKELREAATQGMTYSNPPAHSNRRLLLTRARAHLELETYSAMEADLEAIAPVTPWGRERVLSLRAIGLLRQKRWDEALRLAEEGLSHTDSPWSLLRAVRFEAAHRLGSPEKAGTLTEEQLSALVGMGYPTWAEALRGEFGAPAATGSF